MTTYARLGDRQKMLESRRVKVLVVIVLLLVVILLFRNRNFNGPNPDASAWTGNQLHTVFAITPTYARPVQKAELTRIGHVVQLAPSIHWIIVEDAPKPSDLVRRVIERAGLKDRTTILTAKTPSDQKMKVPNYLKARGVSQRNIALQWIRDHYGDAGKPYRQSVVFFMDDDNTYTVELFQEMGKILPGKVGVWPVGLVGGLMVEKPILDEDSGKVKGFNSQWRPERPFPVDMAGFAISLDLLIANPEAVFSYDVERGYQESEILRHVTVMDELQPLANRCTDILVWHTRTEQPKLTAEEKLNKMNIRSNDGMEV